MIATAHGRNSRDGSREPRSVRRTPLQLPLTALFALELRPWAHLPPSRGTVAPALRTRDGLLIDPRRKRPGRSEIRRPDFFCGARFRGAD